MFVSQRHQTTGFWSRFNFQLSFAHTRFVGGTPRVNCWRTLRQIPARTAQSDALSRDLLRRGFKFVGPTICYAFMQAVGMVNDHTIDCFRYREVT